MRKLYALTLLLVFLAAPGCGGRDSGEHAAYPPVSETHPYIISGAEDAVRLGLDAEDGPLAEARARLLRRADRYLAAGFGGLMEGTVYSRGSRWQGFIQDLWLASRVGRSEGYRTHLYAMLEELHDSERMGLGYFGEEHPTGRVAAALSVLYDLDYNDLSPAHKAMLEDMLRAYGRDLYERSMHESFGEDRPCRYAWNHAAIAYSGLGLSALALGNPDEETAAWLARAYGGVRGYVEYGISDDGVGREGLFYTGYAMSTAAYFLMGVHNVYGDDTIIDPKLGRLLEWYAYETLPSGGMLNNRNDSYLAPDTALGGFLPLVRFRDSAAGAWAWDRLAGPSGSRSYAPLFETMMFYPGPAPASPGLPTGRAFIDAGLMASRSGWGAGDALFVFTSGEFIGCIHDQSDENSFTLSAYGVPLVIDSGAANDPSEGSASQSVAHNSVLIDGRGMAPSGGGRGTDGSMLSASTGELADYALGDAADAYGRDGYNPVERALRHACFVKGPAPYAVTYDDIKKPGGGTHRYDYLLHLHPSLELESSAGGRYVYRDPASGTGLVVEFAAPAEIVREGGIFVNAGADKDVDEHRLERFSAVAVEPGFLCVLVPFKGETPPEFRVTSAPDDSHGVRVEFPGLGLEDSIGFGGPGGGKTGEGLFTFERAIRSDGG